MLKVLLLLRDMELLELDCDILIPAALENQITEENACKLRCRDCRGGCERARRLPQPTASFTRSRYFLIPDVLCNAGGVTVSYFEWVQDLQRFFWDEAQVNQQLERIMKRAFQEVNELAEAQKTDRRTAAYMLAVKRVAEATKVRGLFP